MADVKTVLEAMTLVELEGVEKKKASKPKKEFSEAEIVELNAKLRRPVEHGGVLGIARDYGVSRNRIKSIQRIRKKVIKAKTPVKEPIEEPIEEPIKDPVKE